MTDRMAIGRAKRKFSGPVSPDADSFARIGAGQ